MGGEEKDEEKTDSEMNEWIYEENYAKICNLMAKFGTFILYKINHKYQQKYCIG